MSTTASATDIDFASFCNFIHAASQIKPLKAGSKRASTKTSSEIERLWNSFAAHSRKCRNDKTGIQLFRLLFPELDIRRRYGLKETLLLQELFAVLDIPRDGTAAAILRSWNEPDLAAEQPGSGCLGLSVQKVLSSRRQKARPRTLTLTQVDNLLDQLAVHCPFSNLGNGLSTGNTPPRRQILQQLFAPLDPFQAAVMTQIILKDLSPILYSLPSNSVEVSIRLYNSRAYEVLELHQAMRSWHWAMSTVFRFKNELDEAAGLVEGISDIKTLESDAALRQLCRAMPGSIVQIPKARKGQSFSSVVSYYCSAGSGSALWCEIKYDGERMQIHIEDDQIQIFSKSKRNSTQDRIATHPIIRAALGLKQRSHGNALLRQREQLAQPSRTPITSIILEAEMCAFNESTQDIDEFWRIGQIKGADDRSGASVMLTESQNDSESSLTSNSTISPAGKKRTKEMHYQLVFFDVLHLNGQSLVHDSMDERRKVLESVVRPIHGFSKLAERHQINLNTGRSAAETHLRAIFEQACEAREEGLMLKLGSSRYNSFGRGMEWTKLKKDYIEGLGDSASFVVVGAGHDKERGRILSVPPTVWTTFYIGLQTNLAACKANPSIKVKYHVLFSVSWGLSRDQLGYINTYARTHAGFQPASHCRAMSWPYTHDLSPGLGQAPSYLFAKPMVFEIYGGGWTRACGANYYSLRFPRISNLHCHRRPLCEALDLYESERIAARALSKHASQDLELNISWGKRPSVSPITNSLKRRFASPREDFAKRFRVHQDGRSPAINVISPAQSTSALSPRLRSTPRRLAQAGPQLSMIQEESSPPAPALAFVPRVIDFDKLPSLPPAPVASFKSSQATSSCWWCAVEPLATTSQNAAFASRDRLHSVEAVAVAAGWQSTRVQVRASKERKYRRGFIFVNVTAGAGVEIESRLYAASIGQDARSQTSVGVRRESAAVDRRAVAQAVSTL